MGDIAAQLLIGRGKPLFYRFKYNPMNSAVGAAQTAGPSADGWCRAGCSLHALYMRGLHVVSFFVFFKFDPSLPTGALHRRCPLSQGPPPSHPEQATTDTRKAGAWMGAQDPVGGGAGAGRHPCPGVQL